MPIVPDHHGHPESAGSRVIDSTELAALRQTHRTMLGISVGVIVLSALLVVRPDNRVAFWFLPDFPAPETCFARAGLGIPCPGCGLTRSFVSLAHFDIASAWNYHRLGWLLALVTVAQIPYRLWALTHPAGRPLGRRWPSALGFVLVSALIVNWGLGWLQTWMAT